MSDAAQTPEHLEAIVEGDPRVATKCLLCDEDVIVTKETVVEHLMETHDKVYLATIISLWWFMDPEGDE